MLHLFRVDRYVASVLEVDRYVTSIQRVLDWAQLILHLSRWAAVAGLQVLLPSASNILSKYLRFVWGSHFCFHCQVSLLYCQVLSCEVTLVAVSKYLLGSASWFLLKELLLSVKPVSSSSYLPSHFNFHLRLYKCWGLINEVPTGLGEKLEIHNSANTNYSWLN